MLYDDFKSIVDHVFNNWSALQLAVEHGMGAPGGEATAQQMCAYIAQYCVENAVDEYTLTEELEDIMDEEFETICHDNSPKEIATLLLFFLKLLKEDRRQEIKEAIDAMPKCQKWLSQPMHGKPQQRHGNPDDDTSSSSEDENNDGVQESKAPPANSSPQVPQPMDEDEEPGWTTVRSKRKH